MLSTIAKITLLYKNYINGHEQYFNLLLCISFENKLIVHANNELGIHLPRYDFNTVYNNNTDEMVRIVTEALQADERLVRIVDDTEQDFPKPLVLSEDNAKMQRVYGKGALKINNSNTSIPVESLYQLFKERFIAEQAYEQSLKLKEH